MSCAKSWTDTQFILFLLNVLKPSNIANQKFVANIICTEAKGTLEEPQHQGHGTLATSITDVLLTCFHSLGDAMCDETALCPQCCCVYQLGVLGCKKPIRLLVESVGLSGPFCVVSECRYPCT